MLRFDTAVVSDLHLGARNSRAEEFLHFLDEITVDRLVINGDLFKSPVLRGLSRRDVRVLEVLRQFSRSSELIWLRGNHDPDEAWCRDVLDFPSLDELIVSVGRRSYLICHGHVWDRSLSWPSWIIHAADSVYHLSQRVDPSHRMARWLKRKTKYFCHAVESLRRDATSAARERKLDGVIVGHTHVACDEHVDDLHYLNCGCWTEQPTGFVGIRDGHARQFEWRMPTRVYFSTSVASPSRSARTVDVPLLAATSEGT